MTQNRFTVYAFLLTFLAMFSLSTTAEVKISDEIPPFNQQQFDACVQNIKQQAKSENISANVINTNLNQVKHDPNVIKYDRRQPEFSESFANYFNKRVNKWRIEKGQKLYQQHKKLLLQLQAKYGIAPHYLLSFWGLETNFGTYKGKMSIIRSLVTLACDQRRSAFFTTELMTALKLIEKENLEPQKMLGSWAGAMGHTQFMPSAYIRYAIDGDGDGQVNLFDSIPDALTSAANFLHNLGWQSGFRWGREVLVPVDFAYHNSGMDNVRTLKQWRQLGLTKTDGKPIAAIDVKASLLVPSGHKGPAFLVYDNFEVIMRWNRSEFYAIAVGHLADRISGAINKLHRPPHQSANLTLKHLLALQLELTKRGFNVGKPDGIMGPATAKGIRDYQQSQKMIADGFPHDSLFASLGIDLKRKVKQDKQTQ